MKKSIGMKLFIGITCFVVIIVSLSWILNTKYLEKYYLEKKSDNLIQYGEEIKSIYNKDIDDMDIEFMKIENQIGADITIFSKDGQIKYSSLFNQQRMGMGNGKMGRNVHLTKDDVEKIFKEERILKTYQHPRLKAKFLVLAFLLKEDDVLVLETSVASITESVEIAKDFYIYIGIISLIIGAIVAFLYSRRFTKPIIELNNVAKSMGKLDFSQKYDVKTDDEIGELGKTINDLSEQLNRKIAELNEANERLKEDIEKEKKIDAMRKEFISSVSHELKTPIALIQGYAEGLKDNIVTDEENKNFYCEVITDETEKMEKLVKGLLELSKIESGSVKLENENFNIVHLVEKIVNKYKPILNDKNINLIIDHDEKELKVKADISKIEQVLVNFINNAMNHIDENGKLKISLKDEQEKIRVSVCNSGSRIPKEEMDRIWDSFYKIDKSRAREYGGTGLGLSIVKGILELHNNAFGVLNKDEGVEFWFELHKI